MKLDAREPSGPIAGKWDRHKFEMKLVNPANKRRHTIIVVGTGLAGASAAASLGELGYNVLSMVVVGSHLWHGVSSAFQSLGADNNRWTPRILLGGKVMAVLIAGGFIVIALWVHFAGARS